MASSLAQTTPLTQTSDFPLAKADQCVKCGLCLPHCPTYALTQNEAESPRGRIALMQGLATGQLQTTAKLEAHVDSCLSCRACESVCPAQVPYGELIDAVRTDLQTSQPKRNRSLRWLAPWLIKPGLRGFLGLILRLLQVGGLLEIAKKILGDSTQLGRKLHFIPPLKSGPAPGIYAASRFQKKQRRVQLFTGCVSELFDGRSLQDAVKCLQHCGFEVEIQPKQGCCGALHQHNGMRDQAQIHFSANLKAFSGCNSPIVGTASGCTAMLAEYGIFAEGEDAGAFSERVEDISAFLLRHWPEETELTACGAQVYVQEPCTLRNVLGSSQAVYDLLGKIPGLVAVPLPGKQGCCGAAGNMMFSHAQQADSLVDQKIAKLEPNGASYLVSSNIGCALHLRAALLRSDLEIEVIHPVSLLAQHLGD